MKAVRFTRLRQKSPRLAAGGSLSENIATFDATAIPEVVFASTVGNSAPGQTASAVKAFSAVAAGPPFDTLIGCLVLPSITARSGAAFILNFDSSRIFTQGVLSSSFTAATLKIKFTPLTAGGCRYGFQQK